MTNAIELRIFEALQTIDTNGGGAGLAVETWYLAKKDLASQAK